MALVGDQLIEATESACNLFCMSQHTVLQNCFRLFRITQLLPDNEMFVCKLFYIVLSGSLGTAVNSQRIGIVKTLDTVLLLSVETSSVESWTIFARIFLCHDA